MKIFVLTAALLCVSATALADKIAVVGGKVFTGTAQGTLESATVLIDNNTVVSVSNGADVPAGYTVIDATGKYVTPGLVGAYTQLGLVEVGMSAGTVDSSVTTLPISATGAAYDVSYAVNPDSSLMAISRVEGVICGDHYFSYRVFIPRAGGGDYPCKRCSACTEAKSLCGSQCG